MIIEKNVIWSLDYHFQLRAYSAEPGYVKIDSEILDEETGTWDHEVTLFHGKVSELDEFVSEIKKVMS